MRIWAFSTDDFLYPAGGAETAFFEVAKRMSDSSFTLVCGKLRPGVSRKERVGNIEIYRVGFGSAPIDKILLPIWGTVYCFFKTWRTPPDLFWAVMVTYASGIPYLVNSKRKIFGKKKIPVMLNLQEGDSEAHLSGRLFGLIDLSWRSALGRTDGVSAISTYLKDRAKRLGYRGLSRVVPNGVDFSEVVKNISDEERRNARIEYGFSENAFILLTTSRLEIKNGVGDVITALSLLPTEVCFVVCGGGSLDSILRTQVQEFGLSRRVKFLGFTPREELALRLASADAFIRPALSEGLGNSFLEAMAAGVPVIGTLVGGIPDFLTDGVTGFACKPSNPKSIAEAVNRVRTISVNQKEEMIRAARDLVERQYTWDTVTASMREFIGEILNQYK